MVMKGIEFLYEKIMNPLDFKFDAIRARPLFSMLPYSIDQYLYSIATHPRYSGNMKKKYELMDEAMRSYGFDVLARGTNRTVYKHYNDGSIVVKVGIDKSGVGDAPKEWYNQTKIKPFCAKTFEVSPTGTIGLFERVSPFTYKDEFISVADDIFDLLTKFILGKYVLADIGTDFYMNWGLRTGFGPVLIDYPFMYELDGAKLHCINSIETPYGRMKCDGLIDYDEGFNKLRCEKCGKTYFASDLMKVNNSGELEIVSGVLGGRKMGIKIYEGNRLIFDNGRKISFREGTAATKKSKSTYEEGVDRRPKSRLDRMEQDGKRPEQTEQRLNPPVPEKLVDESDEHFKYVDRKLKAVITNTYHQGANTDDKLYYVIVSLLRYIKFTDKQITFTQSVEEVARQYMYMMKKEIQIQEEIKRDLDRQEQENSDQVIIEDVIQTQPVKEGSSFKLNIQEDQEDVKAIDQYHKNDETMEEREQLLNTTNQLEEMTRTTNPNDISTSQELHKKIEENNQQLSRVPEKPKQISKTPPQSRDMKTPYGNFRF